MSTLTADQAQSLMYMLLPQLDANRKLARLVVQSLPNDKLDFKPLPEGESIGDLAWYIASASAVLVGGVAEGRLPPPPAKPQQGTVEAFLAWDDEQFPIGLQRLVNVDGQALLRPMSFGHLTLPAIEFVPVFLSNLAQHTGMLMALIAQHGISRHAGDAAAHPGSELTEAQLAQVAGGASATTTMQSTSTTSNGMVITGRYGTQSPIVQTQYTNATLGALLGDGGGGAGAAGAVGGLGMFAAIFGMSAASILAVNPAATLGAIFLGVLMRF